MSRLRLFEGFGVELEYMLVDRAGLDVLPAADRLLAAAAGEPLGTGDVERGAFAWSNELVLHVVELKTNGPAPRLEGLAEGFQEEARVAGRFAADLGGRLLGGGMHPWMDPDRETRLWPHEHSAVYQAFDRIFGCRGHGWSNLQSLHLNLPFADDAELGRLHAAVRLLLPLLPALAAGSPVRDGRATGTLDNRLAAYGTNSRRIPSVAGQVIPEPVFSEADYRREILEPMWADVAPHDPEGVLRDEFLNARGAIARFGRGSLEIRLIDAQEAPMMDLAVAAATVAALRLLVAEGEPGQAAQRALETAPLARLLRRTTEQADLAVVEEPEVLAALGLAGASPTAGQVWRHLLARAREARLLDPRWDAPLAVIAERGPLARRLLAALPATFGREELRAVWAQLADCIAAGQPFLPD